MGGRVDHWLRPNAANRTPRRLVSLNVQARTERSRGQTRYLFRCGAASLDLLDETGRPTCEPELAGFTDEADLWTQVAAWTSPAHRTVCFGYNLSYLLRLARALEVLPGLGFEPTRVVLNDYSTWARLKQGRRVLLLSDLRSWAPASPGQLAGDVEYPAPRQPRGSDGEAGWQRYAARNAGLVRAVALNLVQWVHDDDLGDFRPTGHAQASACFRHRFLEPRTLLVHWGGEPRQAERRSAWAGRAEVWRPGEQAGPVVEYDYTAAYAWLALHKSLPTRLLGPIGLRSRETPPRGTGRRCYLWEAEVEAEVPVLPAELEGRIVWPVGRFCTTVWDSELELAIEEGARVHLRRGWLYERAPVLRSWAAWVLAGLGGAPPGDDPLRRRVLKAWSRSLIGRFALRYPELELIRSEDEASLRLSTVWDDRLGRGVRELQVGRQVFESDGLVDGADSTPQIMASIMAEARVRLWRTMRAAGLEHVLYVDTDSVLVDPEGARRLEARLRQGHFPGLRRKATYRRADLRAPRNLELDEERRIAGLPRDASLERDGRYRAELWEGFSQSLRRSRPAGVYRLERHFLVGADDYRRVHLEGGGSVPLRLDGDRRAG